MKALTAALALLLLAAAGTCRGETVSPLDEPTDISPVELIDASLGPLSELAALTGLSIEDAAALVAARARSHATGGGAAGDTAPRGLISDLRDSVPEAVSDAIDWGKSQLSYYKCVAKCIFKYKAKGAGDMVGNMVGCVLKCNF